MRIALATDWFAPRLGGIETQLVQLAEGLGARGHEVTVLTTTPGATAGTNYAVRAIQSARLPLLDVPISFALVGRVVHELARGYDVVHAHASVVSPVAYAAVLAARRLDVPVVVTLHSVLRAKRYFLRMFSRAAGLRARVAWTAVSELVARQARDGVREDVLVLPNGIDLSAWARVRGMPHSHGPVILAATQRLHRKKRPLALLDALGRAARISRMPLRLVLLGVGPEARSVKRRIAGLAREGVHVELRGRLSAADLRAVYAESDGFVSASRREAFGIAALEAIASGLPVIAMREAGSSEFLEHERNALLCDDDDEMAHALARFASDPALRRRLSQKTDLDRYDWSTVLALHESVYERVRRPGRARAQTGAAGA